MLVAVFLVRFSLKAFFPTRQACVTLLYGTDGIRELLVVMAHGIAGCTAFEGAVKLVGEILPAANRLVLSFDARPIANADAFATEAVGYSFNGQACFDTARTYTLVCQQFGRPLAANQLIQKNLPT